ncbi:MAG: GNAT family N-acetyltransferase [Curvibacter sp.]|nr:GNAT family N-acetyltransferase [Curvibacter sp.]
MESEDRGRLSETLISEWLNSSSLVSLDLRCRPEQISDQAFLLDGFRQRHGPELAFAQWPAVQLDALLSMQFDAQERGYRSQCPGAIGLLIEWAGQPVGRMIVDVSTSRLRLVDIGILPGHRGQGLGTALLAAMLRGCDLLGLVCDLQVLEGNPALRLYLRLGFSVVRRSEPYLVLQRPVAGALPGAGAM